MAVLVLIIAGVAHSLTHALTGHWARRANIGRKRSASNLDMDAWDSLLHPQTDRVSRLDGPKHERASDIGRAAIELSSVDLDSPRIEIESSKLNTTALANIESLWVELRPHIAYISPKDRKRIQFGLIMSYLSHDGQLRRSGEPYITHPVAVSVLLAGLASDADTLIGGLLHDSVEDTPMTFMTIESFFGPTVRQIVEGETKVSKLPKIAMSESSGVDKKKDEQTENLRQMFLAMSEDFRIILVKLADRLHNMRTLAGMPKHKQIRIARETIEIFAVLTSIVPLSRLCHVVSPVDGFDFDSTSV